MQKCIDCGQEFENKGSRRKPYCIDCAFKRMVEAEKQMKAKSGPIYEKWQKSMETMASRFLGHQE